MVKDKSCGNGESSGASIRLYKYMECIDGNKHLQKKMLSSAKLESANEKKEKELNT